MNSDDARPSRPDLAKLGEAVRRARREQGVTAQVAAEAAGVSRPTLQRIERGEHGVAIGSWLAVAAALGLELVIRSSTGDEATRTQVKLPDEIKLSDYPELKKLAWQLQGVEVVSPKQALELYERNWRHVESDKLGMQEVVLIDVLSRVLGGGRLLV